jgi:hypothetical protein
MLEVAEVLLLYTFTLQLEAMRFNVFHFSHSIWFLQCLCFIKEFRNPDSSKIAYTHTQKVANLI